MTSVLLDDGTRTTVQRVGARFRGRHCGRKPLYVNPHQMIWFCFACRTHGTVESIHVEQEPAGELGEIR